MIYKYIIRVILVRSQTNFVQQLEKTWNACLVFFYFFNKIRLQNARLPDWKI